MTKGKTKQYLAKPDIQQKER